MDYTDFPDDGTFTMSDNPCRCGRLLQLDVRKGEKVFFTWCDDCGGTGFRVEHAGVHPSWRQRLWRWLKRRWVR
jgi:hypothetical protein